MDNLSAIMQMLRGTHGQLESVVLSQENHKKICEFNEKYNFFKDKYANNPELIKLFEEVCNAHVADQATAEVDFYISGFSFGVLMGIDIMRINSKNN